MKRLALLLSLIAIVTSALAIPAKPGQWRVLKLKNGSEVRAELKGDEFGHFWQTAQGDCYVESSEQGIYQPADLTKISQKAQTLRQKRSLRAASSRKRVYPGEEHEPYAGKKKGLIILVQFQNKSFEEGHDNAFFNDIANKIGYTSEEGHKGSVKDYFLAQSDGVFELDFDVVGPLTLPRTYGYYGANTGNEDTNPGLMTATACEMADEFVNFQDYDWDGDGEVDQVFILFAGLGEAAGGDANTIWPHEYYLEYSDYGKTLTLDDVIINTYACGSELTIMQKGIRVVTTVEGIGTICHEFSHCLGLPDMYDPSYGGGYGMQSWDLMASGSYNDNSFTPAGFTSYERMFCGWRQPIVLTNDTVVTDMKAIADGGDTYIIYNDAHPDEYYLLENRQKQGWDDGLPGSGLLVIHVDFDEMAWMYNFVNNYTWYPTFNDHERCTVIAADNSRSTRDVSTDVYPYKEKDSLTNSSLPRAELYNLNPDGIHYTSKPITNIRQNDDGTISFRFQNLVKTPVAPTSIEAVRPANRKKGVFDLMGRKHGNLPESLPKGIYVIDGRKVIFTSPAPRDTCW